MIGIVLVTHGNLAVEFVSAMQHVVGHQQQVETVCMAPDDDVDTKRNELIQKVKATDTGDGVAVLTDMFGGTPSNLAISILDKENIEVIAGVNLPMLIKIASLRKEKKLQDAVKGAQEAGIKYIRIASELLKK